MKRALACIGLVLLASGCASPKAAAPGCSGPRRPANPYGSVLTGGATADAVSATPPGGHDAPETASPCGKPS